jgi:8-oxo-dGTP diphosphatase
MLPPAAIGLLKEVARHILRRPVVGIVAAARTEDGRWVLIRRGDTGGWALPGGTLEWGETLRSALEREMREEAGIEALQPPRLVGVFSRPDRDLRFHAVTVVALCKVTLPSARPMNSLEIRDVGVFDDASVPELAMDGSDMLAAARAMLDGGAPTLE